jgi:hypothetical protein
MKRERTKTFCHISEFNQRGYDRLHFMAAVSKPLVLWAPSSHFLQCAVSSGKTTIDFATMFRLMDQGFVEVIARQRWLEDETWRRHQHKAAVKARQFHGYSWASGFDDEIRRRLSRGEGVRAVGDPDGEEVAGQTLLRRPPIVREILDLERRKLLPAGTVQYARSESRGNDDAFAFQVIRHARNHTRAWLDAKADQDLLPCGKAGAIWQFVEPMDSEDVREAARAKHSAAVFDPGVLAEAIELLADRFGRVPHPTFLGSPDHDSAARWFATACAQGAATRAGMANRLRSQIKSGDGGGDVRRAAKRARDSRAGWLWFLVKEGLEWATQIGLGFVKPAKALRELVRAETPYSGPEWPFRYLCGKRPNARGVQSVLRALRTVQRG